MICEDMSSNFASSCSSSVSTYKIILSCRGRKGERGWDDGAERTNAVSSCGLEISAGSASDFGGLGEETRDPTGVLEPP